MARRWHRAVLTASALLPLAAASAFAGPNGASVAGGAATVQGQGTANVIVNQSSQNAIINWQTFNIGTNETTKIFMPNSSSTQLDRVTGGQGPSQILGTLTSNGKVFLVNPDGILFGMGATINVGSLLATTHDIANSDFMAGRYNFSIPGNPNASIVNLGTITAQTGGFAALVAPGVRNTGTIVAKLGTIALASGNAFTLDMYGDNLITLGLTDKVASQVIDVATGKPLKSLVGNEGKLKANGGTVVLTAVGARKIVDSVINNSGVIEANTIGSHNGKIVLGGPTGTSKYARARKQTVTVSGTLSAAGKRNGTTGGTIQITGENIQVAGATINASGQAGGGTVLIGGDWGGGHPNTSLASGNASATLQPYAVPNANTVSIDAATTIDASATATGNGGKVIVWANQATTFLGTILAKGGAQSGNGGFVETSGHQLSFNGTVNTLAPNGANGTLLLDPADYYINATGAPAPPTGASVISNVTLENELGMGSVVIATNNSSNPAGQSGNIYVNAGVTWGNGSILTLNAANAIDINAPITITGAGGLTLFAATANSAPLISFGNGASVQFTGTPNTGQSLSINSQSYSLLYSMTDVQGINSNLSAKYALAVPLDASSVTNWTPIGTNGNGNILNDGSGFNGAFQGLGNTISNLTINLPSSSYVGLFGYVGPNGSVQDVGLIAGSVIGQSNVGALVAYNAGTVSSSYATTQVTGDEQVGGLVGWNTGTITLSYATGQVKGNADDDVGGLVGYNPGGTVSKSYATGNVSGPLDVGGLIGDNSGGTVSQSYAAGTVTGTNTSYNFGVGGLVGYMYGGTISQSYATGAVSAPDYVGGLVGWTDGGRISQSYAIGSVNGTGNVGGLIGYNNSSITQTYATGAVTGATLSTTGGLVGLNDAYGTVTASYWDKTTGPANGFGTNNNSEGASAAGLTTTKFGDKSNFSGWRFGTVPGTCNSDGGACWVIVDNDGSLNNAGGGGATRPMLLSEWSSTITNPHQLQLMALDVSASYTLASTINLGPALSNPSDVWGPNGGAGFVPIGNSITNFAGTFNGNGNTISGLSIAINHFIGEGVGLFGVIGAGGTVENVNLTNAVLTVSISTTPDNFQAYGLLFGENVGGTISNDSVTGAINVSVDLPANYIAQVGGLGGFSGNGATITQSQSAATVTVASGGSSKNALVVVGGLVGNPGSISGSSAGGAVTVTGDAVAVAGGLAGIGGPVDTSNATGAVTGGDTSILGGLIGLSTRTITSSHAIGAVKGGANSIVGGLVGVASDGIPNTNSLPTNGVTIESSFATGLVSSGANSSAGGLVGQNGGTVTFSGTTETLVGVQISQSYAIGAVTAGANANAGGLVGLNTGTITGPTWTTPPTACSAAYTCASGLVTVGSEGNAGGLVGENNGTITSAFAIATVTGAAGIGTLGQGAQATALGGLVGDNTGQIANSFALGIVGSPTTPTLAVGGLVGTDNALTSNSPPSGTFGAISGSFADVTVSAGDNSVAGGLVGSNGYNGGFPCGGCTLTATITNSNAYGDVTVGASSVAGGLVGFIGGSGLNTATISGSNAYGSVSGGGSAGGSVVGGLVGISGQSLQSTTISNSSAQNPQVVSSGPNGIAGGLVGVNSGLVTDSFATAPVSGGANSFVGGLAGATTGTITLSDAIGPVTGGPGSSVGGLVGLAGNGNGQGPPPGSQITLSYATGAVSAGDGSSAGGLVGENGGTGTLLGTLYTLPALQISQSYATGNVTAGNNANAGGLVGLNAGTITGPSWTTPPTTCDAGSTCYNGTVTVGSGGKAGGLVGDNNGTITNAFAIANVIGAAGANDTLLGGLAGTSTGQISGSFASGTVGSPATTNLVVGGLVGGNGGTISGSFANVAVSAGDNSFAGGLVGINANGGNNNNAAAIINSNASGNVTAGASSLAGGLLGQNSGTVTGSHATGAVTVGANSTAGGLVGINFNCCDANGNFIAGATISNSYATGPVSSAGINVQLGGLVGQNAPGAQITNSQATGPVTSTVSLPPSSNSTDCSLSGTCLYVNVGGFVGANFGSISGTTWTTPPASCATGGAFACAGGNVTVGPLGSGGGFAGYNEGIIKYAFATGAVTGAAGLPDTVAGNVFNNTTQIAGFVADNRGQIAHSFATGAVGTAGTMWLSAGGFAGENKGTIDSSFATGAVMAGDTSTAGGFTGGNGRGSNTQTCPFCFVGDGFNNSAAISNSQAFGTVTVGALSVAGGFAASGGGNNNGQSGGSFTNVTASGAVNAGHDSIVGGLVGVLLEGGTLANSAAQNTLVASSGANSIVGGIVGLNFGTISDTTSTAPVSGTSDSYIGGITGINLGQVTGSSTDPDITGSGGGNFIGGIAGLNAGSINDSTANIALITGPSSYAGGVAGVNGSYSNTSTTIPNSSFPNGTITNSSATGTGFGSQTGTSTPAQSPNVPSWLSGCTDAACTALTGGSLQSGGGGSPSPPSTPPSEPPGTPNSPPPTVPPTDTLANQQVMQFAQPVNFTTTNIAPPLVDPATLASLNGGTPGNAGNGAGGTGSLGNGNTGSLASGREGGNGAPPGVRLIDMPVMPLPPGSGVPPLGETRFLINEVVLQFGPEVTPQQVAAVAQRFNLTIVAQQTIAALHRTVYTFRINNGRSVAEVIRQIESAGLHVAAQPNYTYQFTQDQGGSSADLGDPAQYIVPKLQLGAVHRITQGNDIVVALIDSRVDTKQPDFAGRIVDSYDAGCGPNAPPDAHGTGMAGAIASHVGLLGVAPSARIIAICAFGGTGSPEATSSKIIRGVDYAIAHGAKIINMSFAGPRDPALAQELQIAREKGILIVAAAGNAGPKSPPLYPGADPNVMAVTATDEHDRLFTGANQGGYVTVAAPGVNILVPAPNGDVQFTTGTSVASANVSGVAALLMADKPTRTPEEIRSILVSTAKHLGAKGVNPQFGAGLVDPLKALRFVPAAIGRSSSAASPIKPH